MQEIRAALRGKATLLMGKNTMMRKAMRGHMDKVAGIEKYVATLISVQFELTTVQFLLIAVQFYFINVHFK